MARITPSDVVSVIEATFPWCRSVPPSYGAVLKDGPNLAALVGLTKQIPESLLQLTSADRRDLVWSLESLDHLVRRFEVGVTSAESTWAWPYVGNLDAITRLWQILRTCPDQGVAESTPTLTFLDVPDFELSVRLDISAAEEAFNNGSWKAATVLAGSAVEALLLWEVTQHSPIQLQEAIGALDLDKLDVTRPERWALLQYIKVARELDAISQTTADQCVLAKDF